GLATLRHRRHHQHDGRHNPVRASLRPCAGPRSTEAHVARLIDQSYFLKSQQAARAPRVRFCGGSWTASAPPEWWLKATAYGLLCLVLGLDLLFLLELGYAFRLPVPLFHPFTLLPRAESKLHERSQSVGLIRLATITT